MTVCEECGSTYRRHIGSSAISLFEGLPMIKSSRMRLRDILLCMIFATSVYGQVRVINDGFPGENTAELDSRLDNALALFTPDYVVVFAGVNDALNERKFLRPSETGSHLQHMADRVKAHRA